YHLDLHSFPTRRSSDLPQKGCSITLSIFSVRFLVVTSFLSRQVDRISSICLWRMAYSFCCASKVSYFAVAIACSTKALSSLLSRSEEHTSELQSRENLV